MLTQQSFTSYLLANVNPPDPDEEEEKNLLTVPLYHIAGIQGMMAAVYGGRSLVVMRQFEPVEWMELVQQERANRAMLVPTMIKWLMDHREFPNYDLSSLEVITYGAAPMPLEVISRAIAEFPGARFINAFGQTETASTITMLPPDDHVLEGTPEEVEKKLKRLTSIGKPLDDVEVRIVNEDGDERRHGRNRRDSRRRRPNDEGILEPGRRHPERYPRRMGLHRRPGLPGRRRLYLPFRQGQGLHQTGR